MKLQNLLFLLLISLTTNNIFGQYTVSPSDGISTCPSSNLTCSTLTYLGGQTIKMSIFVSGNNASFTLTRCTGGNFSTSGNFYIKETDACGTIVNNTSVAVTAGTSSAVFSGVSLLNNGQPKTFVGVYITSATNPTRYYTGPITVTPTCATVAGGSSISISNITETSYTGSWSSVSGASSYRVENVTSSTTNYPGNTSNIGNTTTYNFSGLTAGGSFKFQVGANCSNQKVGLMSSSSNTVQLLTPLNIPTLLSPIGNNTTTSNSVNFSWSKNGNPAGTNYQIKIVNVTDGNTTVSGYDYLDLGDVSSINNVTLLNGKQYRWIINATKNNNNPKESAPATFYTPVPSCNLTLPSPNSGNATNINSSSLTANWPAVSGATEYEINVATFPNTTYAAPLSFTGTTTTNSINVTGLNHSTQYRFQIRAKCSSGVWTAWSSTLDTPTTKGPLTVANLSNVQWHCNKNITWTSLAGVGNVTIELWDTNIGFIGEIATNIANNGSYTWIVGKKNNNVTEIDNFDFTKNFYIKMYPHGTTGQGSENLIFTVPQPTLTISSPAANTNYTVGQTITMDYATQNLCGPMMVELTNIAGTTLQVMPNGSNIPNVSPYTYTVTNTFSPGTYKLKIYPSIGGTGSAPVFALSEQFNIVGQSVNVTSPAANSTYQAGISVPIEYTFTGYTGNVSIEITAGTNGTVGIPPAIADGEPNTGSKSWLIPSSFAPGQYRIKVYNRGSGSIVNYSGVFTITGNTACPNCLSAGITETNFPNTGNEGFCAAQYLCNLGIIQPQQNNTGYTPVDPIKRADLAKLMLYALFDDGYAGTYHQNPGILTFPVDSYVTPFEDLNYNNNPANYDRPAKVMSYLYYANDNKGLTPFKRTRTNFYPYENITRMDFLQVLLEAWNVPSDATVNAPFTDDFTNVPAETRQYINKAYSLGIITHSTANPLFRPYDDIKREEAYTILARLRKLTTVTKPAQAVLTNAANYIFERNITTDNISIMRSMGEGNFAYGEDAFAMGDIGFPLSFGFSYNSFSTHLPDVYRRIEPLGIGWTHNLNSYIQTTSASVNEGNIVVGKALLLLANGDGTWHTYDNSNPSSPMKRSIDNFNTLNVITNSTTTYYEVKRPDQVTFKYEKQGSESGLFRLTSIKDRYGNTLTVVYKQGANVPFSGYTHVIDYVQSQSGRRAIFTYNTDNQITEVQFPGKTSATPRRLQFAYYAGWDGKTNYLRKFTSARHYGTTKGTTYTYGSGLQKYLLVSVKRPKGNEIKTEFGTDNKLQKIEEQNGTSTTSTTTIARTTGGTCPQGTTCVNITNSDNTITSQKINLVGTVYEITSPTVSFKLPEYSVNPSNPAYFEVNGKRTQYEYNGVGNVLIVKYMKADNTTIHSTESFGYDQYNNLSTHTDRNGITTNFDFSIDGKFLDGIRRPFAQNQTINQTFRYYTNGLLKEAISHEGINTLFYYDNYGNNNRIEFPLLSLNSYASHDYAGRTLTVTNAKNQVSTFEHDDNDNLTKTIAPSPLSYVTQYGFDDNDLLNTITNAKGKVTTIGRDNFDRVETITFEAMQQKYYYRTDGKLDKYEKTGFATNNNRYFQYAYDAQGKMTSNRYLTNVTFDNTTKNIQTITGGTSALLLKDFTFDELNRPTGYTDNNNVAVGYGYDNNGNVTRIDYPNGHKVYYTYDQANRLRTVKWNTTTVATYVYVGSRLSYVEYGNGVRTTYNYDNAGRLDGIITKTNNGSGSTIAGYTFEFDNLGNHLAENITEPYNTLPTPPASTTTYTYKTNNQIEMAGSTTFTHDGDGNIITKGGLTYTYDLEDNLISITGNGLNISFEYDAMGNRRIATRNSTVTKYVLDMLGMADVLAELNGSNAAQNYYIHGLGLVARVKGDGSTIHYYHADFRGSVVAMTNASQTITHKYQYDEYGNLTNSQEADPNPFRYVGTYGIMYETADLSYMRARYYDPTIGRFNSTDPIWSTNLYPYANNNPTMNVDVNGENPLIITAGLGTAIGGIVGYGGYILETAISGEKFDFEKFGDAGIDGAVEGFLWGSGYKVAEVAWNAYTAYEEANNNYIQTGDLQHSAMVGASSFALNMLPLPIPKKLRDAVALNGIDIFVANNPKGKRVNKFQQPKGGSAYSKKYNSQVKPIENTTTDGIVEAIKKPTSVWISQDIPYKPSPYNPSVRVTLPNGSLVGGGSVAPFPN